MGKLGSIGRGGPRATGGDGYVMSVYLMIKPCVGGLKSINSGGDPTLGVIQGPSWASAAPLASRFLRRWSLIVTLLLYA